MSRIVCVVNWANKGQVTWDETIKKILQQASVEITHNKQLRDKLEEEREKGKFILSLIWHRILILINSLNLLFLFPETSGHLTKLLLWLIDSYLEKYPAECFGCVLYIKHLLYQRLSQHIIVFEVLFLNASCESSVICQTLHGGLEQYLTLYFKLQTKVVHMRKVCIWLDDWMNRMMTSWP